MKSGKHHILWIPPNGVGKIHKFMINPVLIRIFMFLLFICVCAVPFMETGLISLAGKVNDLEQKKLELHAEIRSLQYLRKALARLEEKESAFRGYFGMEEYRSLEEIPGSGGTPAMDLSLIGSDQHGQRKKQDTRLSARRMTLPLSL